MTVKTPAQINDLHSGVHTREARQMSHLSSRITPQGEVMNVEAAPAAVGAAAPMIVPSEPVSIVVDEKLMVVLNKDGGVESMEVNGGMALQVTHNQVLS